jgi:hypothetical protein
MAKKAVGGDGRTYVIPDQFLDPTPEPTPVAPPKSHLERLREIAYFAGSPQPPYGDWTSPQVTYLTSLVAAQQSQANQLMVIVQILIEKESLP